MEEFLPTEPDFVFYGDVDEVHAYQNFLGKTKEQALPMFLNDFYRFQEDMMFMGPVAFCYYCEPFIDSLKKSKDLQKWLLFSEICEYRLTDKYSELMRPCAALIAGALDFLWAQLTSLNHPNAAEVRRIQIAYRDLSDGRCGQSD
jgi:hypothetical protein